MEACIDFFEAVWKREEKRKAVKLLILILLAAVLILEMAANPLGLMSVKESIQSGMEGHGEKFDHDALVGIMDVEIPTGTVLGEYSDDAGKIGSLKEMIPKEELSDAMNSELSEWIVPTAIEPVLSEVDVSDITNKDLEITEPVMPGVEDEVITDPGTTTPAVPDVGISDPANFGKSDADSAFLIDEAGMLYGFLPEKAVIVDGVLELPMEGCIGIYKGVFAGYGENIIELYIPSNISVIEDGAFVGLDSLEWIEAAGGNSGCVSVDGVLFDSSLTSLLAFPNGRTGVYIVPANVTRIADGAFANTSLSALDMRSCGNVMMEDGMFGGSAGESVEILMPRGYFAE